MGTIKTATGLEAALATQLPADIDAKQAYWQAITDSLLKGRLPMRLPASELDAINAKVTAAMEAKFPTEGE